MSLKSLRSNQGGFVIIIALGMILILSIFAIIIQQTTINTLTRMKDYENVWHAESYADSGVDYLQWIVNNNGGAGINSGKIVCKYGESANENEVSDKVEGGGAKRVLSSFRYYG